ncbi:MAG: hydrogenase nickel incorporation protein HypB [Anaerolineales bacterium]
MSDRIEIVQNIMGANDKLAADNRTRLDKSRTFGINFMASPGAGKTSLIEQTVPALKDKFAIGAVDGDIATTIDADRAAAAGAAAVQINTGGECHLDAVMLQQALNQLDLDALDLLIVENVGNLICTADFKIGTQKAVCLLSVPEGDDKPIKYPLIFTTVDAVVITKMDYLPLSDFNVETFQKTVKGMNENAKLMKVSAKTGEGVDEWIKWLEDSLKER